MWHSITDCLLQWLNKKFVRFLSVCPLISCTQQQQEIISLSKIQGDNCHSKIDLEIIANLKASTDMLNTTCKCILSQKICLNATKKLSNPLPKISYLLFSWFFSRNKTAHMYRPAERTSNDALCSGCCLRYEMVQ